MQVFLVLLNLGVFFQDGFFAIDLMIADEVHGIQ
jgi:hypothetical protein